MKNQSNFIVYKAENIQNGYVYVGSTTKSIEERKRDHEQKANNGQGYKFQEAISTYGTEAFSWEQIDTASSLDELAQKEKQYILEYNSREDGYNVDSGGGFKKTVYQYDLKSGKLLKQFDSLDSASNAVNAIKQQISRACLSVNKTFGGYRWSYEYKEPFIPEQDKRARTVKQYDSDGSWIKTFSSVAEASWETNVSKSSIAKVCRGERKTAGGYVWRYV